MMNVARLGRTVLSLALSGSFLILSPVTVRAQQTAQPRVNFAYVAPSDPARAQLLNQLLPQSLFAGDANFLERYAWPTTLDVAVGDCTNGGSAYLPAMKAIRLCLSDAIDAYNLFIREGNSASVALAGAQNSMVFAFLHEAAHALIEQFDLPTTGSEEDAADEYAAITMASQDTARFPGIEAAYYFLFRGVFEGQPGAWDSHGEDKRRSAHIACLIDGASPGQCKADLAKLGISDQEPNCTRLFARQQRVWNWLLAPHLVGAAR